VPGSIHIQSISTHEPLNSNCFRLNSISAQLIFLCHPPDSIRITYRSLPYFFAERYFHKDIRIKKKAESGGYLMNPFAYVPDEKSFSQLNFNGLEYSGSLTRGITFGNNQDLALNSSLNLQMSGKITPEIEVLAALTDNNIPIQPDGNTQRLQEFDKIFIQLDLYHKHRVTLGDFELSNPASHFLRYTRNMQGIKYSGILDLQQYGNLKISLGGALSKGKFSRNTFKRHIFFG
jgi:hypothetical protein